MTPNKDEYGEIINGQDTYEAIAWDLNAGVSTIIGWTDGIGTHYDILFTKGASRHGDHIQGGVSQTDLFVSIMRKGSFGFNMDHTDTDGSYYAEKLNIEGGETAQLLGVLINNVKIELNLLS